MCGCTSLDTKLYSGIGILTRVIGGLFSKTIKCPPTTVANKITGT
jgi:hypothetical protein